MASVVSVVSALRSVGQRNATLGRMRTQIRSVTTTNSGAVLEEPAKVAFGIPKVILTVLPGLYIGATLSKTGAAFLEENDIFVPADDDDDD